MARIVCHPRTIFALATILIVSTWLTLRWPYIVSRWQGGPEGRHPLSYVGLPVDAFNWTSPLVPTWLQRPVVAPETQPLVLRVAIISHPAEFSRRKAIRDHMLVGVPYSEVDIQYYFFLGKAEDTTWSRMKGSSAQEVDAAVHREAEEHNDIHFLDMVDNKDRLGYKCWRALQWAAEADSDTYDWFFTMDSDSFVRFAALARRLATIRPDLREPRKQSIMWGQMLPAEWHWRDSHSITQEQRVQSTDKMQWYSGYEAFKGEWYSYPVGLGYLLSSHLVARLTSPHITLACEIKYPFDDMVVGSWVSDVAPAPDTAIVDDWDGFHDPPRHGWKNAPIGWDTVVIHHVDMTEMRSLREMEHWRSEWEV